MAQYPLSDSASGIWTPNQARNARRGDNWPGEYRYNFSLNLDDIVGVQYVGSPGLSNFLFAWADEGSSIIHTNYGSTTTTRKYSCSTPYDISTRSTQLYSDTSLAGSYDRYVFGISFNDDGTKFFTGGPYYDVLQEYTLSTPWDTRTETTTNTLTPPGNFINHAWADEGRVLFTTESQNDRTYKYNLSTAYDLSTAVGNVNDVITITTSQSMMVAANPFGTEVYIVDSPNIHKYVGDPTGPWQDYTLDSSRNIQSIITNDLGAGFSTLRDMKFHPSERRFWIADSNSNLYEFSF